LPFKCNLQRYIGVPAGSSGRSSLVGEGIDPSAVAKLRRDVLERENHALATRLHDAERVNAKAAAECERLQRALDEKDEEDEEMQQRMMELEISSAQRQSVEKALEVMSASAAEAEVGLSLPGDVRLVTWTPGCHSRLSLQVVTRPPRVVTHSRLSSTGVLTENNVESANPRRRRRLWRRARRCWRRGRWRRRRRRKSRRPTCAPTPPTASRRRR
jgi:hypothetical protein